MGRSHDDQLSFDFDAPEPSTRLTPSEPEQDPSDDSPDGRSIHASDPAGSDRQQGDRDDRPDESRGQTTTRTSTMSDDHDINLIDSIPIEHDSPMLDAWRRSPLLDETK